MIDQRLTSSLDRDHSFIYLIWQVFFFNHMVLKTSNEAVVESMGCIVDKHATGGAGARAAEVCTGGVHPLERPVEAA